MHSVGRWPRFSCMPVNAGTISSISVISSSASRARSSSTSAGRIGGGTVCSSSHSSGAPVGRIAGQQLVQERRARAAEAGDDDRRRHGPRRGWTAPRFHRSTSSSRLLQDRLQLGSGPDAPGEVEVGLLVERAASAVERLRGTSRRRSRRARPPRRGGQRGRRRRATRSNGRRRRAPDRRRPACRPTAPAAEVSSSWPGTYSSPPVLITDHALQGPHR